LFASFSGQVGDLPLPASQPAIKILLSCKDFPRIALIPLSFVLAFEVSAGKQAPDDHGINGDFRQHPVLSPTLFVRFRGRVRVSKEGAPFLLGG
jgi:hypothetical protein